MADATPVAALGRLILNFRLITLLLSTLYLSVGGRAVPGLPAAIAVAGLASFVPLMTWNRLAPWLMRHPTCLLADLSLTVGILLFTGIDGPFLYYTLGTAFLAGVLYGWVGGGICALVLVLGYAFVLDVRAPISDLQPTFQTLVGTPSLYLIAAAGAAAVRSLRVGKARAESELAEAMAAAATAAERTRLAREMHDTLGKTLYGIALSAAAIPRWLERDRDRAVTAIRSLARAAETAAGQARELISDLRADRLDVPLHEAVAAHLDAWANASGIAAHCHALPVHGVSPSARFELFCILKEALRNVERHARACQVWVKLEARDAVVWLEIADDGVGLHGPPQLEALAAQGHYGLVGIVERAERAGGRASMAAREPAGFVLAVEVPASASRAQRVIAGPIPLEAAR